MATRELIGKWKAHDLLEMTCKYCLISFMGIEMNSCAYSHQTKATALLYNGYFLLAGGRSMDIGNPITATRAGLKKATALLMSMCTA